MTRIIKISTKTLLNLLSLLTYISSSSVSASLTSLTNLVRPYHHSNRSLIHQYQQLNKKQSRLLSQKFLSRHYIEPIRRNAPNPLERPYFTRSPSASPSKAPSMTPTSTPICQLNDNGGFGTVEENISTTTISVEYTYEMNIQNTLSREGIQEIISKIEHKLGTFVVSNLWDSCPDILYGDEIDEITTTNSLRLYVRRRVEEGKDTLNQVDTDTLIDTEKLENLKSIVVSLSIDPQDQLSNFSCRELLYNNYENPTNCRRIDGVMTLFTHILSSNQSTELISHVQSILEDTLNNPHFLDDIDENSDIRDLISTDPDYTTIPPVTNLEVGSSTRKEDNSKTWILAPAAAMGAVVIAITIKLKRRQWLKQKSNTTDDGSFSLSSYGSWFRKKGGNMHVDANGNVETQVVV